MQKTLLSSILFAGLATAGTINLTPISDGLGTVGAPANFQVVSGTITTNNTGFADIVLDFNYRPVGSGGPSTDLGGYVGPGGIALNVGDLLFQVGSNIFGIPLASHSGAPNGGNAAQFASVTAGHFYQSTNELTANTVLNNPSGVAFRPNADVWLGANVTDLGTFSETIQFTNGATPSYVVEFKGQLPSIFLTDVANNGGLTTDFASATCGNGLLVGSGNISGVPEPTSLLLAGCGLLGLGLIRRSRKRA